MSKIKVNLTIRAIYSLYETRKFENTVGGYLSSRGAQEEAKATEPMDHFWRALVFLLVTVGVSGDLIYTGTDFVLALFPIYETNYEHKTAGTLYISHKEEGLCNVTDSDGRKHMVSLHGRDTVTQFHLPVVRLLRLGTFIETRGISIHCSVNVNIVNFFRNIYAGWSDAYPVFPVETLSTKYFIPSVNTNALFGIIANKDNTLVNIHLKTSCNYTFQTSSQTIASYQLLYRGDRFYK